MNPPPAADATWHPSWPSDAQGLVERAIQAHGGRARFAAVDRIVLGFGSLTGALPRMKGSGRTFPMPSAIEIWPHRRMTVFRDYPNSTHRGRFVDGAVSLERTSDNAVVAESPQHRGTFAGLRKLRRWAPIDALYFFGYALWHYHAVPFTLGAATFIARVRQQGCDGVEVDFRGEVPTHSRRQRFYFNAVGAIVRHDYVADVVGVMARGCHFWLDQESTGGLLIARHRRVVARAFGHPTPLTVLDARLVSAQVFDRTDATARPDA